MARAKLKICFVGFASYLSLLFFHRRLSCLLGQSGVGKTCLQNVCCGLPPIPIPPGRGKQFPTADDFDGDNDQNLRLYF